MFTFLYLLQRAHRLYVASRQQSLKLSLQFLNMKSLKLTVFASCLLGAQAQVVQPDCGGAFQPCCAGIESCREDLSCIDRGGAGIVCEPCGDPFSQPCPSGQYCSSAQLVPTASTHTRNTQGFPLYLLDGKRCIDVCSHRKPGSSSAMCSMRLRVGAVLS